MVVRTTTTLACVATCGAKRVFSTAGRQAGSPVTLTPSIAGPPIPLSLVPPCDGHAIHAVGGVAAGMVGTWRNDCRHGYVES